MMNVQEIKEKVEAEIKSYNTDDEYYGTVECENNETEILKALEELGYNFEQDKEAVEYFLKATPVEVWEYHLENILPKLSA